MSTALTTTQNQTTVIPSPKMSVLMSLAARYNVEPNKLLETLKNTVFKNSTEAQLMALCIVADQYKLNPFTKQIYAFPDKGGGIVPVIGVDGWFLMMNQHPEFDGIEIEMVEDTATGKPFSCTATIHIKNRKFPTKVTEHLSECARNTDPWNKQPRRMLRHRAIIQCARVAFGFSAMDPEEADAINNAQPANPSTPNFGPPTVTSEPNEQAGPQAAQTAPRRGRPLKTLPAVHEAEQVEPKPTQAAPEPAVAAPAAAPEPSKINYVRGIRGMLALSSIDEADLLAFGRETKGWDDSLSSIEEVAMTSPSKLEQAYNDWPAWEKAIKGVNKE